MGDSDNTIHGARVKKTDAIKIKLRDYPKRSPANDTSVYETGNFYSIVINNDVSPKIKMLDIFDRMPYGLIDKRVTGIGATYLEMHAERNSIIVLPNRALAQTKYKSMQNKGKYLCYYVGGKSEEEAHKRTVKERFEQEWAADDEKRKNPNVYCKILVVSDSLKTALEVTNIVPSSGDYFLMIDELDSYQIETTFRKKLANVIDIYFLWKKDSRAMVSATFRHESLYIPEPDGYEDLETTDPVLMPYSNPEMEVEGEGGDDSFISNSDDQQSYEQDEDCPVLDEDELIERLGNEEFAAMLEEYKEEREREGIKLLNEWKEHEKIIEVPHSSMEQIQNEPWIQINYKKPSKRDISLIYTNSPTECLIHTLSGILEREKNPTILVAYNLFDGIKQSIQQLEINDVECKVFFSEHRINNELEKYHIRLQDFNNYLRQPDSDNDKPLVVFMTCAFFVGIDINDTDVHLIMVSNSAYPHTLLSIERIDQICGRLRKGAKDRTLIYDSTELRLCSRYNCKNLDQCFKRNICYMKGQGCLKEKPINPNGLTPEKYENMLINRANAILSLTNDFRKAIEKHLKVFKNKDYWEEMDIIDGALGRIAANENQDEKVALTRYDIDENPVIHYLNLDAIVDTWKTKNVVYRNRNSLCHEIYDFFGPSITIAQGSFFSSTTQKQASGQGDRRLRQEARIKELFADIEKYHGNPKKIQSYLTRNDLIKERPQNDVEIVAHIINRFSRMLSPEDIEDYLFKFMKGRTFRKENLKNFYRSLSFMLLPDDDVFKRGVLRKFNYLNTESGSDVPIPLRLKESIHITEEEISDKMSELIPRYKYDYFRDLPSDEEKANRIKSQNQIKQRALVPLFKCFFELTKSKSKPSIIGLYPASFKVKGEGGYSLIKRPEAFIRVTNTEDMISKYFFPNF